MDKLGEVNRHTVSYIMLLFLLLLLCSGCNRKIANGHQSFNRNQIACDNLFNRAVAHEIDGEYKNALADLGKAIKIDPTLDQAYFNRASVWMQMGRLELALRDVNHAIRLAPGKKAYKIMVMALKSRIAAASNSI